MAIVQESVGGTPTVALADEIDSRTGDLEHIDFLDWALKVPEAKTGTLNFKMFPYQVEMYKVLGGPYRDVVVRKATQVGVSALLLRWGMYEADRNGNTVLYVFPTSDDVYDFADTRISPLFDVSDYLAGRRGDPFNKGLKRVGRGLVYFRGSESKRKLDSVDGDCLALDEYDTLNQKNIPDAERRLSGVLSKGLIRRVGVPSLPEYGIAEQFDISDQRKWLVKCRRKECDNWNGVNRERGDIPLVTPKGKGGGWQEMDFWRNVAWEENELGEVFNAERVCANCGHSLEAEIGVGQWVAQQPGARIPGFHVSRLIVPNVRLEDVIKSSKKMTPYEQEVFYNKDLGLPYISKDARLSPAEIKAAQVTGLRMVAGYAGNGDVTMGIDVASERALNVRISLHLDTETKNTLWIGEIEDSEDGPAFDQLAKLMVRYNVKMAVIDAMPESRLSREFATKFPGRIYLCRYADLAEQVLRVDEDLRVVTVRRTEAIDATNEMIRRQRNHLPEDLPDGYVSHLSANVRRVERDEFDKVRVYWEATRPNDYSMAEVYDLVATDMWWIRQQVEDAADPHVTALDEMVPFNRTTVNQLDDTDWSPGPDLEEQSDSMYGDF